MGGVLVRFGEDCDDDERKSGGGEKDCDKEVEAEEMLYDCGEVCVGLSDPEGSVKFLFLVDGRDFGMGIINFGGGKNINFGWLIESMGFNWEFNIFLGAVLGRSSSLFRLAMLDAYG